MAISYDLASESFTVDGVLYTLIVDQNVSELLTVEERNNAFDIQGRFVTRSSQLPEPGTLALLGMGLLAPVVGRRLRRA